MPACRIPDFHSLSNPRGADDLTTTELLLEATAVAQASWSGRRAENQRPVGRAPGRVHALMGANGAGKSTPLGDTRDGRRPRRWRQDRRTRARAHGPLSPGEARRGGDRLVYQEPGADPGPGHPGSNLRLTETPVELFLHWVDELAQGPLICRTWRGFLCRWPRSGSLTSLMPSPSSPTADAARRDDRGAACQPDRARLEGRRSRQRGGDRCVIFISRPYDREIAAGSATARPCWVRARLSA